MTENSDQGERRSHLPGSPSVRYNRQEYFKSVKGLQEYVSKLESLVLTDQLKGQVIEIIKGFMSKTLKAASQIYSPLIDPEKFKAVMANPNSDYLKDMRALHQLPEILDSSDVDAIEKLYKEYTTQHFFNK